MVLLREDSGAIGGLSSQVLLSTPEGERLRRRLRVGERRGRHAARRRGLAERRRSRGGLEVLESLPGRLAERVAEQRLGREEMGVPR